MNFLYLTVLVVPKEAGIVFLSMGEFFEVGIKTIKKIFMNGVQLSEGYRATRRRQFTFVSRSYMQSTCLFRRLARGKIFNLSAVHKGTVRL